MIVPFGLISISKNGKWTSAPCSVMVIVAGKFPWGSRFPRPSRPSHSTVLSPAIAVPVIVRVGKSAGSAVLSIIIVYDPAKLVVNLIFPPLLLTCPEVPSTPTIDALVTVGGIRLFNSHVDPPGTAPSAAVGRSALGKV